MLNKIISWFTGGAIKTVGEELNKAYKAKLNAANDKERIEADKQIAVLEARSAVLIQEQGHWMTRWIRPAFAFPFIIYNFKIIVWDRVLAWGETAPLPANFWELQMIIFGAYFLTRPIEKFITSKRKRT